MSEDTLNEKFEEITQLIKSHKGVNKYGYFFPSDIIPHSSKFKRLCAKMYKEGFLERQGDKGDRWGYQYKLKL